MSFEEYLVSKKIDSKAFYANEQSRWEEWDKLFAQMSAESFTAQKLYLINPIRRKYQLHQTPPVAETPVPPTPVSTDPPKPKVNKPVFKPKIS